jgi:hypothetical protein
VLKIRNDGDIVVVSGRLQADNLDELAGTLDAARATLDLEDLVLVDEDAVRFLCACEHEGIVLRNCPRYVRTWMKRERAKP